MDEAETHAKAIVSQNAPLMKMILYGMIPESIRFTFDLTLYPKLVKGSSDPSHFIFKINVGKFRIRHRTPLK